MKFMILVKSNPDLEARLAAMSDSQMKEQMAAMGVFNEDLKRAGVMKDCDGLRPSREGKRVRFDGNTRTAGALSARPDAMRCRVPEDVRSMEGLGACFSKRAGEQNPAVIGGLEAKLRVKSERRRIRVPDFYLDRLAGT